MSILVRDPRRARREASPHAQAERRAPSVAEPSSADTETDLPEDTRRARISVVIPAKDEARNLPWVLGRMPDLVDEIVLVDGLSRDDTVAIARMVRPDVVVVHEERRGKGVAVRAGFAVATGDFIVMLDADGSMDPQEIGRFVAPLTDGYDFVKGSRFLAGGGTTDMTLLRKTGNAALMLATNILYRTRFSDLCYGYVAFRRHILPQLALTADGFEIEMQLIARAVRTSQRIHEVPSFESPRMHGKSNLRTFPDGWRVLRSLLRERVARITASEAAITNLPAEG